MSTAEFDLIFVLLVIALSSICVPVLIVEEARKLPERIRAVRIAWDNRASVRRRVRRGHAIR